MSEDKPEQSRTESIDVLVIDDEALVVRVSARFLANMGLTVKTFGAPLAALSELHKYTPKVVVCDYELPGMNGETFLGIVAQRYPQATRVLASSHRVEELKDERVADRSIVKPFTFQAYTEKVREAMAMYPNIREQR